MSSSAPCQAAPPAYPVRFLLLSFDYLDNLITLINIIGDIYLYSAFIAKYAAPSSNSGERRCNFFHVLADAPEFLMFFRRISLMNLQGIV